MPTIHIYVSLEAYKALTERATAKTVTMQGYAREILYKELGIQKETGEHA